MKVPIKFRGKEYFSNSWHYGYFVKTDDRECGYIVKGNGEKIIVDPDSVSQLVGYDSISQEVYEGDNLVIYDDSDFGKRKRIIDRATAKLLPNVRFEDFYNTWGDKHQ
ncbi:MAG: hypothetical protein IKZ58_06405 [Selenomonadaceae bacterium]|nr:hypothetical protein [Selenomonadaceae bacterium]